MIYLLILLRRWIPIPLNLFQFVLETWYFLGGQFYGWVWRLSFMGMISLKYVYVLSYEVVSELWISCLSINGYSPYFPNPYSPCCKRWSWQGVAHLLGMGMFGLLWTLAPKEGRCLSSLPVCPRQRPLPPGAPQPVPLILVPAPASPSLLWQSHPVGLWVFKCSLTFSFVDGLPSHFPILDLFPFSQYGFISFLKAVFFCHFYKFEWGGGRYIFIDFLSWTGLSLVDVYFPGLVISNSSSLFFLLGGNYHCFRGRAAAGTLWTEGEPTRLPSVVWMIFSRLSVGLLGASIFWPQLKNFPAQTLMAFWKIHHYPED